MATATQSDDYECIEPVKRYIQYYTPIPNDEEGGVTFTGVGLRFVPIGRTQIEVYDLTTNQRLLTPGELKARADSAETRIAELEAILRSKGLLPPT